MDQKLNVRKLRKRNQPIDIINIKAPTFSKEEYARFIKEWEEATRSASKLKTIVLNTDLIEYKGCIRKVPRYISMHKAVRKIINKKVFEISNNIKKDIHL